MAVADVFYSLGNFFGGNGKWAKKQFFNNRLPYQINKGKIYLNTEAPYNVYNTIPQIGVTVDKLASMFANGVFKIQKIGSDKLDELPPDMAKLLENPNLFHGQNEFMKQYMKQLLVYGNQYIKKNQASRLSVPKSLINVSPAYITPVLTGKMFDQVKIKDVVSAYEYSDGINSRPFDTDDILWSKVADLDNPIIGHSPLLSLKFPISNNELAYKYLNCISGEMGALGTMSPAAPNRDSMGIIPMTSEQKKELEAQWRKDYGVEDDQMKTKFSEVPMQFSPTTYPTGQLLLLEQIDANFATILDKYGVNRNVFLNSTFENLLRGLISTHNDTVVPHADNFTQNLGRFIGVAEGSRLVLDYSHLPYLQPDKASEATTFNGVSSGLSSLVAGGIISTQQASAILVNQFGVKVK